VVGEHARVWHFLSSKSTEDLGSSGHLVCAGVHFPCCDSGLLVSASCRVHQVLVLAFSVINRCFFRCRIVMSELMLAPHETLVLGTP